VAFQLQPNAQPDPEREERMRGAAARVEIRPSSRVAHLAVRSLACPSCGVPIALNGTVGWREPISCAFCDHSAPTRDYVRDQGWPEVELIARLG
jgi:hypothetical protein